MTRKLHYPKIPSSKDFPLAECIAFEKYDGTNMHFSWHRGFGWHAFGTRRDEFNCDDVGGQLFTEKHPHLHEVLSLFRQTLMAPFEKVFESDSRCSAAEQFTVFAEFLGKQSFAGLHQEQDTKQLVVFDVECDGAMFGPHEFVDTFGHLSTARVVYRGRFTGAFAENVRNGKYGVAEGVICKTGTRGQIQQAKIKTYEYLAKLKKAFGEKWEDYWE